MLAACPPVRIDTVSLPICNQQSKIFNRVSLWLCFGVAISLFAGCDVQRRKSDAELGLNAQQAAGRRIYDNYCDRCHEPYSSRGKKGPSMKGLYKREYMELSGLPVNDDRVTDIILHGRSKMEAFGQVLTDQQVKDLLAYLHTL
jgi:mono/diheme cytochrome c family protein